MTGPHPAVAATRHAVRGHLADVPPGALVLIACSGGPDSLALAAAAAFEAPKAAVRLGAVVVDHALQEGSAAVAERAAAACAALGADPVVVSRVAVTPSGRLDAGGPGAGGGPEAAARAARYAVLAEVARAHTAYAVWLGHTLDDQAEQVLLGLARGSGTRSLAGMPRRRPPYERPFLALPKAITIAACRAQGLEAWTDPTNADPAYLRNRVRAALRDLEDDLGPRLAAALARSADLARADADALDELTDRAYAALGPPPWPVEVLAAHPAAIRGRLWRRAALAAGAPEVGAVHVRALDALVTDWHGQGPAFLPGGLRVIRRGGLLAVEPSDASPDE